MIRGLTGKKSPRSRMVIGCEFYARPGKRNGRFVLIHGILCSGTIVVPGRRLQVSHNLDPFMAGGDVPCANDHFLLIWLENRKKNR